MTDAELVIPGAEDRSQIPGAMEVTLTRTLPGGGRIDFESAPSGWLAKGGTPRAREWRRYYYTAPGAKREIYPSVTTICGDVLPKTGLTRWYEEYGIKGARVGVQRGLLAIEQSGDEWVRTVRAGQLGAEAARDEAAERGLNTHSILENYLRHGAVPNPADHPQAHRAYIRGLMTWLRVIAPQPIAIEVIVADPERCYAGRADLLARIGADTVLVDLKTSPTGAIFDAAHLQVELLRQAEERFGEHKIDRCMLVSVDRTGGFREMACVASPHLAERAIAFHGEVRQLVRDCTDANKIHRLALEAKVA